MVHVAVMRDGIFRSAPVPKTWKKFGKRASREADHGARLNEAMDEALRKDAKSLGLKIRQFVIDNDQPSLVDDQYRLHSFLVGLDSTSQFERDFRDAISRECSKGVPRGLKESLQGSLSYALERYRGAIISEFKGHALKRCLNDMQSFRTGVHALDAATAEVSVGEIAKSFVATSGGITRKTKKQKFNYDENLLE